MTLRHLALLFGSVFFDALYAVAQAPYETSVDVLDDWIANTDASLTFRGAPRGSSLGPFDARVIWCTVRDGPICGGQCTVYTGRGDQCFAASGTSCVAATVNITFCASGTCTPACNIYRSCGTRMNSGFCFTPFTGSVQVPIVEGPSSSSTSSSTSSSSSSTSQQEPTPTPPPPTSSTEDPPSSTSAETTEPSSSSPTRSSSSSPSRSPSASSSQRSSSQSDGSLPTGGVPSDGNGDDGSSNSGSSERKKTFPIGAIVGIVLGTLVIVCATILIIFWLRWKQQREQRVSDESAGTMEPFMQTSPSYGSHPSTHALLSYTSAPSSNGYVSPALIPPAGTAHTRSTSDLLSTVTSTSTASRPLRKGEVAGVPVSRPADNVPEGQFVVVHADSGLRAPRPSDGGHTTVELPPMYTPS